MKKIVILSLVLWVGISECLAADDKRPGNPMSRETVIALSKQLGPNTADLIMKGKIAHPDPVFFSLDTFMRLESTSFETRNHWSGEKEKYTGVSFIDLLKFIGMHESASKVEVIATNDYRISINTSELEKYEYVLSYRLNGKPYSRHAPDKDKGPIAIAINFDKHTALDREIYKHHLVWFVNTIVVK